MKMRKWYVVLIALAVIAVAWGIGARIFIAQKSAGPESPLATVSFAYSTNAKGQPWAIQTGESKFTVASKETYPRFVLGTIDPTKVSIGDTQTMQIMVRDNVPLVKVWAEVEHDHGIDSIPLTLGASSTVSYNTIQNQKYLVGNDGKLVINDGQNKTSAIAALIQSLFQKAQAEQAVDYSYSGSWVVHDTATITYHTTFYAMDAQGRTTKLVLAWSDPCSIGTNGLLGNNCSLASATDGTDGMSTNLNGYTLTLQSGGLYVVNPNYSIILTTANSAITFTGGVVNTQDYLYYPDADGDHYAASATKTANAASSLSGYVRVSSAVGTVNPSIDCDDKATTGVNVHPGQATFYTSVIASDGSSVAGTYDYNCSGTTVKSWINGNSGSGSGSGNYVCAPNGNPGWPTDPSSFYLTPSAATQSCGYPYNNTMTWYLYNSGAGYCTTNVTFTGSPSVGCN